MSGVVLRTPVLTSRLTVKAGLPAVPETAICRPAPAFRLQSSYTEYRQYTWHTNRDTYDKIVFDDLKNNATMAAMLVYAASEDRERVPRDQSILPPRPNGEPRPWISCGKARRSFAQP